MGLRTWGGIVAACLLATAPVTAGSLPCEPNTACALQLTREAAFRRVLTVDDDGDRRAALEVLTWTVEQENPAGPARQRPDFAALRARIDAVASAPSRPEQYSWLARAMAASGLVAEARLLSKQLDSEKQRGEVQASAAGYYARSGRVKDAFAAVNEISTSAGIGMLAMSKVVNAIVASGKPELVLECIGFVPGLDEANAGTLIAIAHFHGGRHEAARAQALAIKDAKERFAALTGLYSRYRDQGSDSELLTTARLVHETLLNMPPDPELDALVPRAQLRVETNQMLIDALNDHQHAEKLALIAQLPVDRRAGALMHLVADLRTLPDVRAVDKILASLPDFERLALQAQLAVSRVRIGEISAEEALKKAAEPDALIDDLLSLVSEFSSSGRQAEARLLGKALTSKLGQNLGMYRRDQLTHAQIDAGMFKEAESSIRRQAVDLPISIPLLMKLSVTLEKAGQSAAASKLRAEAVRESGARTDSDHPDGLAQAFRQLEMYDEAVIEMRRLMAAKASPRGIRATGGMLANGLARRGDLARALEFSQELSKYLGDDPDPFLLIYTDRARTAGPTIWMLGLDAKGLPDSRKSRN